MSLSKDTQLGTITVNDNVIAKAILRSTIGMKDKLFFATEKGKLLGSPSRVSASELSGNLIIEERDGKYNIVLYVVTSFGASIKNVTETVFDMMQKEMQTMFPDQEGTLIIKIVGVKSKNIAERNIEVKREYGASR